MFFHDICIVERHLYVYKFVRIYSFWNYHGEISHVELLQEMDGSNEMNDDNDDVVGMLDNL